MTSTDPLLDSRRAWFMWAVGTVGYISAVMQRTTFGVAGVMAGERFSAGASVVSLFVVVQLLTYALMQVPVGVLADRFGTRLVLGTGAMLMALGQLDLAFSTNLISAIIARILVGAGDAMTFGPLLRLLPAWFSARRIPILNQLVGMTGQVGQILSAVPFVALLNSQGWTPAFGSAAAVAVVLGAVVLALLRNAPAGSPATVGSHQASLAEQIAEVVREPAAQLGFWIHWMCASWTMLFAFMWGFPFLTKGIGLAQAEASGLFTLFALAGLPSAPLIGLLSRRAPMQRSNLAFIVAGAAAVPWAAVLLWPGPAPLWLLVLLVVGLAAGGPGSSVGFDVGRTQVPGHRVGTMSGFIIAAGFMACLLNIWVVGLVLDLLGGYTLVNFKWAMATQFVFLAVGIVGVLRTRRVARAKVANQGVLIQPLGAVLRRETVNWLGQWRDFVAHRPSVHERPDANLSVHLTDGSAVDVVALIPGSGGDLVAIDVPPPDADGAWWASRVGEYLRLVADETTRVGSVEVRCPDAAEAARARDAIEEELRVRGAQLPLEVSLIR